jgi:hypothetical protein
MLLAVEYSLKYLCDLLSEQSNIVVEVSKLSNRLFRSGLIEVKSEATRDVLQSV